MRLCMSLYVCVFFLGAFVCFVVCVRMRLSVCVFVLVYCSFVFVVVVVCVRACVCLGA